MNYFIRSLEGVDGVEKEKAFFSRIFDTICLSSAQI